ncbi:hypothetical protein IAT38_007989 [Cryptococcus sp. DSM 104549]
MATTPPTTALPADSPPISPTSIASSTTYAASPSSSRRSSLSLTTKLLSLPSRLFPSPKMDTHPPDLEKGPAPPASPSLANANLGFTHVSHPHTGGSGAGVGFPHVPHLGLRKRRLLSQAIAVVGLVIVAGWVILGDEGINEAWGRVAGSSSETRPHHAPIPGVIIGTNGSILPSSSSPDPDTSSDTSDPPVLSHAEKMAALAGILPQPWGLTLSSSSLLQGLSPWPANPPIDESAPALSSLGHFADDIYDFGPRTMGEYRKMMGEFVKAGFPKEMRGVLMEGLVRFLGEGEGVKRVEAEAEAEDDAGNKWDWDREKYVWQTDKDERHVDSPEVTTWKHGRASNEKWEWDLMTDKDADKWVKKNLGGSRMQEIWNNLPSGILRSDTLRYLLLLLRGGIYSDTDTALLKAPSKWGHGARLWKRGEGWLSEEQLKRIEEGEEVDSVLGRPSMVVGLEADVGDREDWFDWWPRPIQIVQWTMASTPSHPIALNALLRILHSTAHAISWSHQNARVVKILKDQGKYADAKAVASINVLAEPKDGGPVGVMGWTGPGVWTDAVLSYLRVKYGVEWTEFKGIQEPLRIGDVVMLPVTGFSPGVGNFGSQHPLHREAMVEHKFAGSWKNERREAE